MVFGGNGVVVMFGGGDVCYSGGPTWVVFGAVVRARKARLTSG